MGDRRGSYRILVGRPEGRRPVGRPRCRWEDITMDLNEVGRGGGMDWIELAQGRAGSGSCKRGNEHSGSIECRGLLVYLRTC